MNVTLLTQYWQNATPPRFAKVSNRESMPMPRGLGDPRPGFLHERNLLLDFPRIVHMGSMNQGVGWTSLVTQHTKRGFSLVALADIAFPALDSRCVQREPSTCGQAPWALMWRMLVLDNSRVTFSQAN